MNRYFVAGLCIVACVVFGSGCSDTAKVVPPSASEIEGGTETTPPGVVNVENIEGRSQQFVVKQVFLLLPNGDEIALDSKRISRHVKIMVRYEGDLERAGTPRLASEGVEVELERMFPATGEFVLKPSLPLENLKGYELTIGEETFAFKVRAPGDINGDGFSDIVVGMPAYHDGTHIGGVFAYYGNAAMELPSSYQNADLKIYGGNIDAKFGAAVAVGDINGDGIDDLAVGLPGAMRGAVIIFFGREDLEGVMPDGYDQGSITRNNGSASNLGAALAIGDVNGDGFGDIVIGEYKAEGASNTNGYTESGAVHVVFGKASGFAAPVVFDGTQPAGTVSFSQTIINEHVGEAVAAADVNGDGIDDVIIGAPFTETFLPGGGLVFVVPGSQTLASGSLTEAPKLKVPQGTKRFGLSLAAIPTAEPNKELVLVGALGRACVADLEETTIIGEGVVSLPASNPIVVGGVGRQAIVGDPLSSKLYTFNADGTLLREFTGDQPTSRLGAAITAAGDIDGDGILDFVVGEPSYTFTTLRGRVLVNMHKQIIGAGDLHFGSALAGGRVR